MERPFAASSSLSFDGGTLRRLPEWTSRPSRSAFACLATIDDNSGAAVRPVEPRVSES